MNAVASTRIVALDVLRGISILAVIGIHTSELFPTKSIFLDTLLRLSMTSIQLFYFVSAFTMCHLWQSKKDELGPIVNFYLRRICRIAPFFWIMIPVSLATFGMGKSYFAPNGIGIKQIVLSIFFLHGLLPDTINSVVSGQWSIAVEMSFYAIFPFLMLLHKSHVPQIIYLLLAIAVYFLYNLLISNELTQLLAHRTLSSSTIVRDFLYLNFLNQLPIFLVGCFLFLKLDKPCDLVPALLIMLMWLCAGYYAYPLSPLGEKSFLFLIVIIVAGFIVYSAVYFNLNNAVLERIGKKSYLIYLTHSPIIYALGFCADSAGLGKAGYVMFAIASCAAFFLSDSLAGLLGRLMDAKLHRITEKIVADREKRLALKHLNHARGSG